jgi:hypothetical protein
LIRLAAREAMVMVRLGRVAACVLGIGLLGTAAPGRGSECLGDLDANTQVNWFDFLVLAEAISGVDGGADGPEAADGDGDGDVDLADVAGFQAGVDACCGPTLFADFRYAFERVYGVAAGDVDRDGDEDVVATVTGDRVVTLFNDAKGRLSAPLVLRDMLSGRIAAADVNLDGAVDLVSVARNGYQELFVQLGRGDGGFGRPTVFPVGRGTLALQVADLNADAWPDVVVVNHDDDDVSVLLGRGDGTFAPQRRFSVGAKPIGVAIGDVDEDGELDLAVANVGSGSVTLLFGGGDGDFGPRRALTVGALPFALALAEVDDDDVLDLVVGHFGSDDVTLLRGRGDGTFAGPEQVVAADAMVTSMVVARLNDDEHPDLIVSSHTPHETMILLGDGDGSFTEEAQFGTPGLVFDVDVGDVNGDGVVDLVVATQDEDAVAIRLGTCDGDFGPAQVYAMDGEPSAVRILDTDEDGVMEIVVGFTLSLGQQSSIVLRGPGDGTFWLAGGQVVGAQPRGVAVADLAGNGPPEVVVAHEGSEELTLLTREPAAGLVVAARIPTDSRPRGVIPADLDGDGVLELIVNESAGVTVFADDVEAGWTVRDRPDVAWVYECADFDGDGALDLLVAQGSALSIALNQGTGQFDAANRIYPTGITWAGAARDINDDGDIDVIGARFGVAQPYELLIARNFYDGTFMPPLAIPLPHPFGVRHVAVADFNRDGAFDIALIRRRDRPIDHRHPPPPDYLALLLSDGTGGYRPELQFEFADATDALHDAVADLVVTDLDGDGWPDIVMSNLTVLLNRMGAATAP